MEPGSWPVCRPVPSCFGKANGLQKRRNAKRPVRAQRQLYQMHMDGVEDSTIARHFGLTKRRVHTIIRQAGLKTRRDMTTEVRDGIAEHIRNGYTAKEIAALFGVTYIYVLKVTHQLGLKTNRHTGQSRRRSTTSSSWRKRACRSIR